MQIQIPTSSMEYERGRRARAWRNPRRRIPRPAVRRRITPMFQGPDTVATSAHATANSTPANFTQNLQWPFEPTVRILPGWNQRSNNAKGFGAGRRNSGGRRHAACDLVVPNGLGTAVRAIADGVVLDFSHFYLGTWAVTVRHQVPGMEPFVVRYGEVLPVARNGIPLTRGQTVRAGQTIAKLARFSTGSSMLHFELYATDRGLDCKSLSIPNSLKKAPNSYSDREKSELARKGWHWDFLRRVDLADPTDFLSAILSGQQPSQPVPIRAMRASLCGSNPSQPSSTNAPVSNELSSWPAGQGQPSANVSINASTLLGPWAAPSIAPTVANALAITRALASLYCMPWRIPFTVLEHEGGVRIFKHRDGVMQTTDAAKAHVIPLIPRAYKLALLGLSPTHTIPEPQLNQLVRREFPKRLAVQIACGVQELATQLKRFNGYVALALIAYNTGSGNAAKMVRNSGPSSTPATWESACRFAASLYHQPESAIVVTSPGMWQCDKNIPTWFKHFAVMDRRTQRQLIGYKYLRSFSGCIARTQPTTPCNASIHGQRAAGSGPSTCSASRIGVMQKIYSPNLLARPYREAVAGLLLAIKQDSRPLAVRNCRLVKFPLASGPVTPKVVGD